MIASIRGEVISRLGGAVVIEAAGVGYKLAVSSETLSSVPAAGEQARERDCGSVVAGQAADGSDSRETTETALCRPNADRAAARTAPAGEGGVAPSATRTACGG